MYGMNVHNKVIENSEKESGITIHYVNKNYDEGRIIFQKKLTINILVVLRNLQKIYICLKWNFFLKL